MNCMKCGGSHDVIDFYRDGEKLFLCADCRYKLLSPPRNNGARQPMGRPSLGVSKKVSITMPEEAWEWFEKEASDTSKSEVLRHLIRREQSPESRWSNNAALGYAILGAKKLGYDEEQIQKLVRAIYSEFDWKSVDEAKKVYNESPY